MPRDKPPPLGAQPDQCLRRHLRLAASAAFAHHYYTAAGMVRRGRGLIMSLGICIQDSQSTCTVH
jgi:hypothetical protein